MKLKSDYWEISKYKSERTWDRKLKNETQKLVSYSNRLKYLKNYGLNSTEKANGLNLDSIIENYEMLVKEQENYIWRIQVKYNEFKDVLTATP